jgi:hypothetical protein
MTICSSGCQQYVPGEACCRAVVTVIDEDITLTPEALQRLAEVFGDRDDPALP